MTGCADHTDRFIWNGDQVALETRAGTGGGTVKYVHGLGIDQPLKAGTIVPHADFRGTYDMGSTVAGAGVSGVDWPGRHRETFGNEPNGPRIPAWHGSLIQDQVDGSGLQYRRNRYYDPKAGVFTQEDPIGLAGGMNLYGFAGGDPVNFSDPFGLCVPWPACANSYWESAAVAGQQRGGFAGTAKAGGASVMGAMIEGFGINEADRGMDAMPSGDVALGLAIVGLAVAENLPGGRLAAASSRLLGEAIAGIGAKAIGGAGAKKAIGDINRLVAEYGGEAADWAKMVGKSERVNGRLVQIHWYENLKTGLRTEFKQNLP